VNEKKPEKEVVLEKDSPLDAKALRAKRFAIGDATPTNIEGEISPLKRPTPTKDSELEIPRPKKPKTEREVVDKSGGTRKGKRNDAMDLENITFTITNERAVDNGKPKKLVTKPPIKATPTLEKCLFFPNCTKEDCPFFHPKELCTTFPNCSFGAKCRYIHPPCKFGAKCSRPGCMYSHPALVDCKNGFACSNKDECKFRHPPVACRLGINCKRARTGCIFGHGQACRFGELCRNPGCTFVHIPSSQTTESKVQDAGPQAETTTAEDEQMTASLPKTPDNLIQEKGQ